MSYLPRMSKTYKEPKPLESEESEEGSFLTNLHAASSSVADKTFNPQIALKHYKYYPHPLPVLPGPSVTEEATENELFQEHNKLKRSMSKIEEHSLTSGSKMLQNSTNEFSEGSLREIEVSKSSVKRIRSKRHSLSKSNKSLTSRKKSSKGIVTKQKDEFKPTIRVCLVQDVVQNSYLAAQNFQKDDKDRDDEGDNEDGDDNDDDGDDEDDEDDVTKFPVSKDRENLKGESETLITKSSTSSKSFLVKNVRERNLSNNKILSPTKSTEPVSRSVQCAIFASSDRTFVIPSTINILLKSLAFLLLEINKDEDLNFTSPEAKRLMNQIQLILADFSNQDVEKDFHFQVNYSDSKRVEKVLEDLKKFIKTVYGEKNDLNDKTEALKKIFIELKLKELELEIICDKIQEKENLNLVEVEIEEKDLNNPELTLQNKKLERDQLLAQAEFSRIELVKYQKALAEADWKIKVDHEQLHAIKKSSNSKSKIADGLARKPSFPKFGTESSFKKGVKGKETEEGKNKKKNDLIPSSS